MAGLACAALHMLAIFLQLLIKMRYIYLLQRMKLYFEIYRLIIWIFYAHVVTDGYMGTKKKTVHDGNNVNNIQDKSIKLTLSKCDPIYGSYLDTPLLYIIVTH